MIGAYVDVLLRCGDERFRENATSKKRKLNMAEYEPVLTKFTGFHVENTKLLVFVVTKRIPKKLEENPLDAKFPYFRSMRMKFS